MCKGLTIDDVGVSRRDTVFQEIRPGAGFETGDFVNKNWRGGGYRGTTIRFYRSVAEMFFLNDGGARELLKLLKGKGRALR